MSAPQTFGPFSSSPDNELILEMRSLMETMNMIYARDSDSIKHLRQVDARLYPVKTRIVPDLAFLYEKESCELGQRLLSKKGLDVSKTAQPIVGLILNRQLYDRIPSYPETMEQVIKFFKAKNTQIVLIPHEHGRYGRSEKDDQFLSNYLAKQTKVATLSKNKKRRFSYRSEIELSIFMLLSPQLVP